MGTPQQRVEDLRNSSKSGGGDFMEEFEKGAESSDMTREEYAYYILEQSSYADESKHLTEAQRDKLEEVAWPQTQAERDRNEAATMTTAESDKRGRKWHIPRFGPGDPRDDMTHAELDAEYVTNE